MEDYSVKTVLALLILSMLRLGEFKVAAACECSLGQINLNTSIGVATYEQPMVGAIFGGNLPIPHCFSLRPEESAECGSFQPVLHLTAWDSACDGDPQNILSDFVEGVEGEQKFLFPDHGVYYITLNDCREIT